MGNKVAFVPVLLFLFSCAINHNEMLRQSLELSDFEMATLAVRSGSDINHRDEHGMTVLHHKAMRADHRSIHFLLNNGADPNVRDNFGNTPIVLLLSRQLNDSTDIYISANMLITNGVDMSLRYRDGTTVLHKVARLGLVDLCMILVSLNYISPTVEDDNGDTPLDVVNARISGIQESLSSPEIIQQELKRLTGLLAKLEKTAEILARHL